MKIKQTLLIILLFCAYHANAQQEDRSLNIGDTLPSFYIPKLIRSIKKTINTSKYRHQLLIIDFWATNCSGCVAALPKMQALQKQFGKSITILPVTDEKESYTIDFLNHNKYTKYLKLPSVVEDQKFSSYFKHRNIPHEVWIYKGKIIGITEPEYVDEHNIKRVLNGEQVNWPLKYDYYTFDKSKPLFVMNEKQIDMNTTEVSYAAISDSRKKYSSSLLPGLSGIYRDTVKKTVRAYFLNQSIFAAYTINLMKMGNGMKLIRPNNNQIQLNQVIWEVADISKYKYNTQWGYKEDWQIKNAICFESLHPDTGQTDNQIYNSIITDMNRLLGLKVNWEKRKEKVLVLTKSIISPFNKIENSLSDEKYPLSGIIYSLNAEPDNPYIFNETDGGDIEIPIKSSLINLPAVRKLLKSYGFEFREEERLVDKLVFKEVNNLLVDGEMQEQALMRRKAMNNIGEVLPIDNEIFLQQNKNKPEVITTISGLQYKIIKQGNGVKPQLTDKVQVRYEGRLVNGKIFDSSYEKGSPVDIDVNKVIKGWTEALLMMSEGAEWELYVPAELAYGTHTSQGTIPPNSTLVFKIGLLKILPKLN